MSRFPRTVPYLAVLLRAVPLLCLVRPGKQRYLRSRHGVAIPDSSIRLIVEVDLTAFAM